MEQMRRGLDLPNELAEEYFELMIKELGITEEEIKNYKDDE